MRRLIPILIVAAVAGCAGGTSASRAPVTAEVRSEDRVLINRDHRGVALGGYDPVAYFTEGRPIPGDPAIRAVHQGATYQFASDEHRWAFLREPDRYAPAFGGFCGYAASIGRLSPTSPEVWQIVSGRLVLQHNAHAFELFNQDLAGNLARADANWPGLREHNARPRHDLVNADAAGVAMGGYDPLTYRDGTPRRGVAEHAARYGGATYWFESEEHRATFERDPARWAPAFGGFCGYAASIGVVAPVDPTIFVVVEDRLVLQHTAEALRLFQRDAAASLRAADRNWPELVGRAGL